MNVTNIQDYLQKQGLSSQRNSLIKPALDIAQHEPDTGRYSLESDQVFVLNSPRETGPQEARLAEYYYRFLDRQILPEGAELLGYVLKLAAAESDADCSESQAVTFCEIIINEQFPQLEVGDLAAFFSRGYHRPLCAVQVNRLPVKKQ